MNASLKYLQLIMFTSLCFVGTSAGASKNFWKSPDKRPQQQETRAHTATANQQLQVSQQQEPKKRKGLFKALFSGSEKASADRRSRSRSTVSSNPNTNTTPSRSRVREQSDAPTSATAATGRDEKKRGLFAGFFRAQERDRRTASRPTRGGSTTTSASYVPAVEYNHSVLAQNNRSNSRLVIDISRQKAFLLVNEKVGLETDISSARSGKYTPRGSFRITERVRSGKVSTIYHVVMPYWQRLDSTTYGVHAGYLPGYPASAGCVRLPSEAAQVIFDNLHSGASVTIVDAWGDA